MLSTVLNSYKARGNTNLTIMILTIIRILIVGIIIVRILIVGIIIARISSMSILIK